MRLGRLQWHRSASEGGFTLLEVLVAMSLIGVGFSTTFGVVSGIQKLEQRATVQTAAMLLARATLDEFIEVGAEVKGEVPGELRFAGQVFSYKLTARPVNITQEAVSPSSNKAAARLEQLEVEVFWGPPGSMQSYVLNTLVFRDIRFPKKAVVPGRTAELNLTKK